MGRESPIKMSKQQDYLKQAQHTRENKYTLALKKTSFQGSPVQVQYSFVPSYAPKPRSPLKKVFPVLFIFITVIASIGIPFILKTYASRVKELDPVNKPSLVNKTKEHKIIRGARTMPKKKLSQEINIRSNKINK